jgi:hypothetical protein
MQAVNSKTKSLLVLSSKDKQTYEDARETQTILEVGEKNIKSIGVQSLNILYGIDNININNNVAVVDDGSTSYPVEIPNGNYNIADLGTIIETQLNLLGIAVFGVSYLNNRYIITSSIPIKFVVNPIKPYKNDWASMIGLPKDQPLSVNIVGSVANILYTNKLFITSDEIHNNKTANDKTSSNRATNILAVVNIGNNLSLGDGDEYIQPRNISVQYENIKWIHRRPENNLSSITIRILDSEGLPIPLNSGGVVWDLVLHCDIVEPILIA